MADLSVSDVADGRDRQKTLARMEIAEALKLIRNPPRLTALPTSSRLRCDAGALHPRGGAFHRECCWRPPLTSGQGAKPPTRPYPASIHRRCNFLNYLAEC
jgi:hypothetical protein